MHNHDDTEINQFNAISKDWWDPNGPMRMLHKLNPLRLQLILDSIQIDSGDNILDVGCGGGIFSESIAAAKPNCTVTGIDMAEDAIKTAQKHAAANNIALNYQVAELAKWVQTSPKYKLISCLEMLEHVPDPAAIVQNCADALDDNGTLFLSTINRTPLAFAGMVVGAEYILNWLPKGTHTYSKFIKPSELAKMCRTAGLEVTKIQGLSYNPISAKFSLSSNCQMNYFIIATKPGANK
jgi:2-polyprenyl-6-hydroxyphenyl methylase / 3-demethylubiquinone-9 3-methyltransferase